MSAASLPYVCHPSDCPQCGGGMAFLVRDREGHPWWMKCGVCCESEMPSGSPGFHALLMQMSCLHARKSMDYGEDQDPLKNMRACENFGLEPSLGAWARARDKVTRIDRFFSLKKQGGELQNESVMDSLLDLASYCLLTALLLAERQPHEPGTHRPGPKEPGTQERVERTGP